MAISQSTKTIIGIMLIKFASGFVSDWGVISLYIFSYYHYHDSPITIGPSTNSLAMIILVIPVIICLFISTKIANKIGYIKLIRICACIYFIFPLVSFFNFHLIVFVLCLMIAPTCSFTLSLIPLFNCLYSYYGNNKNLVTGLVIGSFSLGAIIWNLISTILINPDNLIPNIPSTSSSLYFFPEEVADRVPKSSTFIYFLSGILVMAGAFLVNKNQDQKQIKQQTIIQNPKNNQQHHPKIQKTKLVGQSQKTVQTQQDNIIQIQQSPIPDQKLKILTYISQPIVIWLLILNIVCSIYQVYIQINTKLIFMPILQDDHLISLGLMLIILTSAICSVPWGILADKKGPFIAIVTFLVVDFFAKLFTSFAQDKIWYLISMVFLGSTQKTMLVIFGPILVDVFGLKVATELLPLKGISGIISVIIAAGLGMALSSFGEKALFLLCGFSVAGLIVGGYLANLISKHDKINKKQQDGIGQIMQ